MARREQIVTEVTTQFYEMTGEEAHVWRLSISALLDEIIAELETERKTTIESPIEVDWPIPTCVTYK
jgi:hypothetical protein